MLEKLTVVRILLLYTSVGLQFKPLSRQTSYTWTELFKPYRFFLSKWLLFILWDMERYILAYYILYFYLTAESKSYFLTFVIISRVLTQVFPVVYALMTGKSKHLYIEILRFVKEKSIELTTRRLEPETVISDYESSLQEAAAETFQCRIRGCWFYFNQVVHSLLLNFLSLNY